MIKRMSVLGILAAGMLVAGCQGGNEDNKQVLEQQRQMMRLEEARQERDVLKANSLAMQQQLETAQQDADAKGKTIGMLKDELAKAGTSSAASQEGNLKKIADLEKEITLLKAENDELKAKIKALEAKLAAPASAPETRPYINK